MTTISRDELVREIEERKRAQAALQRSHEMLQVAEENAHLGSWEMDIPTGDSTWSNEFYRICGLEPGSVEPTAELGFQIIHPDDRESANEAVQESIKNREPYSIEKRIVRPDGEVRYVRSRGEISFDDAGNPKTLRGSFMDITEQVLAHMKLEAISTELMRSNEELEQFAYVASHDLQEPLRMITSYLQILQRQYKGQLDEEADEFIHYAVDGAVRMKRLINDLLVYSRVGTRGEPFASTDLEQCLKDSLHDLHFIIEESKATITHDPLPTIVADSGQLTQIFQNLISNAIKFRGEGLSCIHVGAVENANEWQIYVRDNGIGIAPQFFDRAFVIFERLHTDIETSGTGIGLAMCKKIIVRHGGSMWVESEPGEGATFYFTISKVCGDNYDGD